MSMGWASLVVVRLLLAASGPAATLERGIEALNEFDDVRAATLFRNVLALHPSANLAAKAHYYLGLVELNSGNNVEGARTEFEASLRADPTFEPPLSASPKARLVMGQARARVAAEIQRGELEAPAGSQVPPSQPGTSPAATAVTEGETPSHAPAYVVGGIAVAALGTGVIFGVLANSALSQAQSAAYAVTAQQQLGTSGTDALVADVLFGVSGAAAVTAAILFFTEHSPGPVQVGVAPLPGGGAALIGGAF